MFSPTIKDLLSALTLKEKANFLAGIDDWHLAGVPRLNIPSLFVADCGHGVTLCGARSSPATCFPTGIGMASTWNEALIERAGAVIGQECRALGVSILLGPKVNLHRLPLNGRSFETFSEDPLLAGFLGAAEIRGIQSAGVGACVKAMAANNQQKDQQQVSAEVDERTLRELYFRVFEIAIARGKPCAVMSSYNRLNGEVPAESARLIRQIVKGEWKFPGIFISDWRAVHSDKAFASGLDLEMPGPGKFLNQDAVLEALAEGRLSEDDLDDRVGRMLQVIREYGEAEGSGSLSDLPEHRAVALEVAEESIVLLKNRDSTLPLDRTSIRRLLVIGPNAAEARLGGGGSASVTPFYAVSPLDGIRELCAQSSVEVEYREGCSLIGSMQPVRDGLEHVDAEGEHRPGLKAEFFNKGVIGEVADAEWTVPEVNFSWGWAAPGPGVLRFNYGARFSGHIVPPVSGRYRLGVFGQEGCVRLSLDGQVVVEEWPEEGNFEEAYQNRYATLDFDFTSGVPVRIVLEYGKRAARGAVRLEWEVPGQSDSLIEAAEAARRADAVIVCAGLSNLFEGGAADRTGIDLPDAQVRLVEAMAAANPRTVVALFNGGPLALPWEPRVSAILEAWYPGQEGGRALARILFGEVNPSGKLPDTIARRLEDHAAFRNYPGDGEHVVYEEGLSVGYRHFDTAGIEPHYPFGFGLSYSTFEIAAPELSAHQMGADETLVVHTTLKNTGSRPGKETVQMYVRPLDPPVVRPDKELRGFQKIELKPGESREVSFTLTGRDLAFYSTASASWQVAPGKYEILVGSHSRALRGAELTVHSSGDRSDFAAPLQPTEVPPDE